MNFVPNVKPITFGGHAMFKALICVDVTTHKNIAADWDFFSISKLPTNLAK